MIGIRFAAAALLLGSATPAAAQSFFGWSGSWEIHRSPRNCTLTHTAKDPGAIRIIITRWTGGNTSIHVDRAGWPGSDIQHGLVALMDRGASVAGGSAMFAGRDGRSGFFFWLQDDDLARLLAAGTIDIDSDKPLPEPSFAMPPSALAERDLDRCVADVEVRQRGSGAPAATPPRLRGTQEALMTPDDYPVAAVRSQTSGTVTVRLTVDAYGFAGDCAVTASSGNRVLDITTCSIYRRRARFEPALDARGWPTMGSYDFTKEWIAPPYQPEKYIDVRRD